jgi:two-component system, NarL family, nitrate/nitrite response regulator NarL
MAPIGVIAVDPREPHRRSAREVVSGTPGFAFLAEAASAEEALEAAVQLRPELVLVEADMPAIDGRETVRLLERALPDAVVVLVSADGVPDLEALTPAALRALWRRRGPD